jgi:hypothetical protein
MFTKLNSSAFIRLVLLLLLTFSLVYGVPLENWRKPFFNTAADMELADKSPSGMFWDDIGEADVFDRSIWFPGESTDSINYLFLEPQIMGGYGPVLSDENSKSYFQINILNQIRYRHLLVRQVVNVDKRYESDKLYPAHKDRDLRGRFDEAFFQVDWKYGFFRLGRMNRNWGPFADRSMVLSSNPYSYDALEWQLRSSLFEFRHLFAAFHYERPGSYNDNKADLNRFLTAHSLNLILGKWVTLGLTETVLFTRTKHFPDLQYINPFSAYTVVNTNQEGKGNLVLAFQWNIHPLIEDVSFRGQVAFDDFQVDNEKITDKEPTHWGIDMGIFWRNPFKLPMNHLLKTTYTYVSPWMYTVPDNNAKNGERYTYLDKSLGMSENDFDRISAGFDVIGNNYWASGLEMAFFRNGGNNVLTRWQDSEEGNTKGLPVYRDSVREKGFELLLETRFYYRNYADLSLSGSSKWVKNKDNISTSSFELVPSIKAELSFHFSNFRLRLPN